MPEPAPSQQDNSNTQPTNNTVVENIVQSFQAADWNKHLEAIDPFVGAAFWGSVDETQTRSAFTEILRLQADTADIGLPPEEIFNLQGIILSRINFFASSVEHINPMDGTFITSVVDAMVRATNHIEGRWSTAETLIMNGFDFLNKFTRNDVLFPHKSNFPTVVADAFQDNERFRNLISMCLRGEIPNMSNKVYTLLTHLAGNNTLYEEHNTGLLTSVQKTTTDTITSNQHIYDAIADMSAKRAQENPKVHVPFQKLLLPQVREQENLALDLLNQLRDVQFYRPVNEKNVPDLLLYAFEELRNPGDYQNSIKRIVKAYMLCLRQDNFSTYLGYTLLTALLFQTLELKPELFGELSSTLSKFSAIRPQNSSLNYKQNLHLRNTEKLLDTMNQGDPLEGTISNEMAVKFQDGKPIVYRLGGGKGDVILSIPAVVDLITTIEKKGTYNPICIAVFHNMLSVVKGLLGPYASRVQFQTYQYDGNDVAREVDFIAQENIQRGHSNAPYEGIILNYYRPQRHPFDANQLPQDVSSYDLNYFALDSSTSSLRRIFDLQISLALQTVTYDPQDQNNSKIRNAFDQYMNAYATMHQELKRQIESVKASLPNGYIFLAGRGSDADKLLTAATCEQIAQEYAGKRIGFVYSNTGEKEVLAELPKIRAVFTKYNIPLTIIDQTNNVEDAMLWVQQAKGTIGVDTFLTHVAEYTNTPTMDIYCGSNATLWRFDNDLIAVKHPISSQMEDDHAGYNSIIGQEIIERFDFHPLEYSSQNHPIFNTIQGEYFRRLKIGLTKFTQQLDLN